MITVLSFRRHDWEGPSQQVPVSSSLHYNFTGYIKLLNTAQGHLTHSAEAMMGCKDSAGVFPLTLIMFIFTHNNLRDYEYDV